MAELKTDYLDDVLDTSQNQLRKYNMIKNDDGTVSFVDVSKYSQNGDNFGAKDINDANISINTNTEELALVKSAVGYTKKNLLKLAGNIGNTLTYVGVTINKTGKNTYTLSGTSTQDTWFEIGYLFNIGTTAQTNNYLELNSSKTYCASVRVNGTITNSIKNPSISFEGNGSVSTIPLTHTLNSTTFNNKNGLTRTWITIVSGTTFDNVTIELQLEEGTEATDFEEYIEDLDTRVSNTQGDIDLLKCTIGYSKKNQLENKGTTQTLNGLNFTVNSDKSVTVSGTSTDKTYFKVGSAMLKGSCKLSGCLDGASGKYMMYLVNPYVECFDKEVEFELSENITSDVIIYVASGVTVNTTFYPMIRPASIEDDTYEPYVADVQTQLDNKVSTNIFTSWASLPTAPGTLGTNATYEIGFASNKVFLVTIFSEYNVSGIYIVETGSIPNDANGKCRVRTIISSDYYTLTPLTKTTLNIATTAHGYVTYMCIGGE